jgi:hypothetical protein
MARKEQDREDLLAEATALVERMELRVPHEAELVVLGLRRDGCLSIYFGADPALHFNAARELRRAFSSGELFKAERSQLVGMHRHRTTEEVQLVRHERAAAAQGELLATWQTRVEQLYAALDRGEAQLVRCVPADLPAIERACAWLRLIPSPWRVAAVPNAR